MDNGMLDIFDFQDNVLVTPQNFDELRDAISATDQRDAVRVGNTISHFAFTYEGGQRGDATIWHDQQRAALCLGGDSDWGDWDSENSDIRLSSYFDARVWHIAGNLIFQTADEEVADEG